MLDEFREIIRKQGRNVLLNPDQKAHNTSLSSKFVEYVFVQLKKFKILESTMQKFGFFTIDSEWWHYTLSDIDDTEEYDFSIE